jgi:hypothetical protein
MMDTCGPNSLDAWTRVINTHLPLVLHSLLHHGQRDDLYICFLVVTFKYPSHAITRHAHVLMRYPADACDIFRTCPRALATFRCRSPLQSLNAGMMPQPVLAMCQRNAGSCRVSSEATYNTYSREQLLIETSFVWLAASRSACCG